MSALSPAEATGFDLAPLEQLGSREGGTPQIAWPGTKFHRDYCGTQTLQQRAEGPFERAERSLAQVSLEGGQPGPRSRIARVARAWGGGTTSVGTGTRCRTQCC